MKSDKYMKPITNDIEQLIDRFKNVYDEEIVNDIINDYKNPLKALHEKSKLFKERMRRR